MRFASKWTGLWLAAVLATSGCNSNDDSSGQSAGQPPAAQALSSAEIAKRFSNLKFEVLDISEQNYRNRTSLAIRLSSPLDAKTDYQPHLQVLDAQGKAVAGGFLLAEDGLNLYFQNIEPEQKYQVAVSGKLTDALGRLLNQDHRQEIETRSLPSTATFASRGSILPAGLNKGLPVDSINVAEVDIDFHRVQPNKIPEFLASYGVAGERSAWNFSRNDWDDSQLHRFLNLSYSGRFSLNSEKNTRIRNLLPLENIEALRQPGLYLAIMKGAGSYPEQYQTTAFVISDLGMQARLYPDKLQLILSSLASGEALSKVKVSQLNRAGDELSTSQTNSEGLAELPRHQDAVLILAQQDNNTALIDLNAPSLDLSEFKQGSRTAQKQELFMYGPRDIYRPGETLPLAILLRDPDARYQASLPLNLKLEHPDGTLQELGSLQGDELGYYSYSLHIQPDASLGSWKLRASLAGTNIEQSYKFRVEQFLPERLSLNLTARQSGSSIQLPQAPLEFDIEGRYLYGALANGNRFSTRVSVDSERSPVASLPGFEFGDLQETTLQEFDTQEQSLDAQGRFSFSSDSQWQQIKSPIKVRVEVSLFDDGGRPVSRHFQQLVWPDDTSIGIRPASFKAGDRVPARSTTEFEVVKANRQGQLLAGQIQLRLIQEAKNPYWSYSSETGWELMFNEKEFPVMQQDLTLTAGQKTRLSLPVDWGQYRVELLDPQTGKLTSLRWIAGEDWWYDSETDSEQAAPRPDQVQVQLDKAQYREGDTAKVKLTPPFDAEALVSIEADRPLWSKRLSLSKSGEEIEIPIGADWHRHDLHISVLALKPGEAGAKPGPNRAFGLLHLPLDRSERKLALSIEAPAQTEPNQSYSVKLKLAQPSAEPVAVTLAAVDAGVLSLTHFKTPDAFGWFFEPRRYSTELKDLYHRLIDNGNDSWAKLRFGGDEALDLSGKQPDEQVEILSLFKGPVRFNAQGEAEIQLDLPDFNGKMRLMALAFSKQQYGSAEQEVTIAAPIVAELNQPRFLAGGDRSQISLSLQNLTDIPQKLSLNLQASHPLRLDAKPSQLELKPQQKQVLQFSIGAAVQLGQGDIELSVSGIQLPNQSSTTSLNRHWSLAVRPAWPAQTRYQFLSLQAGQSLSLTPEMLAGLAPTSLQGRLSLQTIPPFNLAKNLHDLLTYPYGCLEQTSSAAYPIALATPEKMIALGLRSETLSPAERKQRLEQAFRRISGMQKSNGSFGLWNNNSDEEHWLTVYVADFLLNARDAGFEVPADMLERSLKRLEDYLRTDGSQPEERWSNNPDHYRLSYRAYAGYVLARLNRARLGDLRTLFDNSQQADKTGLPLAYLGMALIRQGDNQRGEQALTQAQSLAADTSDRYRWYGDYGSTIRDESLMLALLAKEKRLPANFSQRVLKLSERIRTENYLSTQERNSLFLLAMSLPDLSTKPWQAQLTLADGSQQNLQGGNLSQKLDAQQLKTGLSLQYQQGPMLFASLEVNGYPEKMLPEVGHQQLHLERRFYDIKGAPLTSNQLSSGDLVLVEVRLANYWQRLPDLMLVELLPAGFELENQNLDNSIKLDAIQIDGKKIADIQTENPIKHREFRFDRYIETYDLESGDRLQRSFYLMRAVTPGSYQLPPSKVEDMYHPDVFAVGQSQFGGKLQVTAKTLTAAKPQQTETAATAAANSERPTAMPEAATEPAAPAAPGPVQTEAEPAVQTATSPELAAPAEASPDLAASQPVVQAQTQPAAIALPGLNKADLDAAEQQALTALINAAAAKDWPQLEQQKLLLSAQPKPARGNRKEARKLNEQALALFQQGDSEQALQILQQAIKADPADIEILNNLGFIQLKARQLPQAEISLWRTLSRQPNRAGAWANLAEVLSLNGEQTAAVSAWTNTLYWSGNRDKTRQLLQTQLAEPATDPKIKASLQQALNLGF